MPSCSLRWLPHCQPCFARCAQIPQKFCVRSEKRSPFDHAFVDGVAVYWVRWMRLASAEADFDIRIRARPDQRNTRHPIFAVERLAGALVFFGRQNPRGGCELRALDLSTDCAGGNVDL